MSIGISDEHVDLATSMREWARSLEGPAVARAAEGDPAATFDEVWKAIVEMGVHAIGVPEAAGGGGGSLLDQAVALEACAHELVPGGLLGAAIGSMLTGRPDRLGVQVFPGGAIWDGGAAEAVLGPDGAHLDAVDRSAAGVDLSARHAQVAEATSSAPDPRVRRTAVTLAAAEASGVARWCLETAVEHAKVREQFGQKIGAFQAVKHLCAEMLETAEAVTAAAWDAAAAAAARDEEQAGEKQWDFAVAVAHATCFDGAVEVAKSCIQVLGGIGFTFEHDAHLYLRRALALRALVGPAEDAAEALTAAAAHGVRRRVEVDLGGRDEDIRAEVRATAERIAAADDRRGALVDTGYLTPHWPRPHGLDADAVAQLVIDEELDRAGVERPDLVIAGWAVPTILEHGSDAQRERFVEPSLRGDLVWCQLFSEPGAGSDLAALRTRAERVDGGWRLTGQKVWNSVADRADWGICLARTDQAAPKHKGISYFVVDMSTPGVEVRPLREITGEALFNEVFLDGVFVPDECLVGAEGDGWRLARTTLANERVAMAGARLEKSTERAVELAASRELTATERVAVGRAVALSTVCTLLAVRTTLRSLAGHGPGAESSVAKLLGVRSRQQSAELVLQLHGDRLLTPDDDARAAAWEMLNTRCLSIAGGTTQILRNVAGERILGLPRG